MSGTRIHRFDFGGLRDFRGPIVLKAVADEAQAEVAAPPPPPTFTEADLEQARMAAKKLGYNEGFLAGKQMAESEADQKTITANEVIGAIGGQVQELSDRYRHLLTQESAYLSKLILSVARKVAGEAINERGADTINAIILQCLPVIFSKPRLVVEMNPAVFERALERIEGQLRESGFEGEVQFKANPEMGLSDVNLDWGSGKVNHSAETLWTEIEALIERVPLELVFAETLEMNQNNNTGE